MGDRANVAIRNPHEDGMVFLYTHWGGYELPRVIQDALKRGRDRWDDAPYLARIVFSEMVKGQENENTGFGISTGICDNEHPIIVLDTEFKCIKIYDERDLEKELTEPISFDTFCFTENPRIALLFKDCNEGLP